MNHDFCRIVRRYGSPVTLATSSETRSGMAFVQPIDAQEELFQPTPLGRAVRMRCLCLAEPSLDLEHIDENAVLLWEQTQFRIVTAHTVRLGPLPLFCRAVLEPLDQEEPYVQS